MTDHSTASHDDATADTRTRVAYQSRTTCRGCGDGLDEVLYLGLITPSDFLLPDEPDHVGIPMTLMTCGRCGLVQLRQTIDDAALYRRYWYQSGVNEVMRAELADVVQCAQIHRPLARRPPALVVDVGANDGTLLSYYPPSVQRIAFEPAANLVARCSQHADVAYNDFFPGPTSRHLANDSVAILTSIAMFYDLDDPRAFVREVDRVLADDGVWVVQFQDLAQQIQTNAFDNCCFEHRLYLSLASVEALLAGCDLHVVDVEARAINGGSLRLMIQRLGEAVSPSVALWRQKEATWITPRALERFAWQAQITRDQIRALVCQAVKKTGPIDLYAASTKSSTLVQFCELHGWIGRAVERTPEKVGRRTSGTGITIVSEEEWRQAPAGLALLGAWQFADAFMQREAAYLAQGGGFIVPLPQPRIVYQ